MKGTLPLFEHAHARREDPETSHEAAARLSEDALAESQRVVLACLYLGPRTDVGIADYARPSGYSVSRLRTARAELVTKGLVRDSGRRAKLESGFKAVIWEAVPWGI